MSAVNQITNEQYDSFVFYGSWRTLLDGFDKEIAKELAYNIILLGTSGEIDTDNMTIQSILLGAIQPNIKHSQDRFMNAVVNGAKGGRPKKEIPIEDVLALRKNGISLRKIGEKYGCDEGTIRNRIRDYEAEKLRNNSAEKDNDFSAEEPFSAEKPCGKTAERKNQELELELELYLEKEKEKEISAPGALALRIKELEEEGRDPQLARGMAKLGF